MSSKTIIFSTVLLSFDLLIISCGEDDSTPSPTPENGPSIPKKIVGIDGHNNLISIDTQSGTVLTSRAHFEDFDDGFPWFSGTQPGALIDFLYFFYTDQTLVVRSATYSADFDLVEEQSFDVELIYGVEGRSISTKDFIVLVARNFENKQQIQIVDRNTGMTEMVEICEGCGSYGASAYTIKDDQFFIFNGFNGVLLTSIDLKTAETIFTANLENLPEMLIGESNIYLKSGRNRLAVHDRMSFTKTDEFEFPYEIDLGLSAIENEKPVVFQLTMQPAPVSQVDIVYDFNSNQVLQEFSYERLLSLQEKFDEELNLVSSSVPVPHTIDTDREFVLFLLSIDITATNRDVHYVYSDYNGSFLGHTVVPNAISRIYALLW